MATIIDNLLEMNRIFTEAAATDPITAFLLALGTLLFVFSFGVFGYLTLGGIVDLFTPNSSRRSPPEAGR